jgi:uncharacterized protein YndB with AHSA1/START domain
VNHEQEETVEKGKVVIEPVIKVVEVVLPIEKAFQLFTEGMAEWWPLHTHSIAADTFEGQTTAETVVFEPGEGGRIYEVMSDGTDRQWGTVLEWEPPSRVVFSWKPNLSEGPSSEVEVRFETSADGTRVELEHRGWERFGELASKRREAYETGWPGVLELFRNAAAK